MIVPTSDLVIEANDQNRDSHCRSREPIHFPL